MDERKHDMQRNAQLLCTMDVGKAGWIADDRVSNEWTYAQISITFTFALSTLESISWFETRSPTPIQYHPHFPPPPPDVGNVLYAQVRNKTWILDHKRHQLLRITANVEEF